MQDRTVKGSHILQVQEWIDRRLGPGTFRSFTKDAGDRWAIILPIAWYEVDILHGALVKASERTHVAMEPMTAEIAKLNAEKDLTSFYRMFLRIAQPQRVLSQTPKLWRTYVSFGDATAIQNEPGRYVGQGEGFTAELLDWACGCWLGFIPTAIRMAGAREAEGKIINRWRRSDGLYALQLQVDYR
jgi:hypothetical protein